MPNVAVGLGAGASALRVVRGHRSEKSESPLGVGAWEPWGLGLNGSSGSHAGLRGAAII
ncbi:uncharacterized protein LDX57_006612 [Aspergillus melleus]|uniref:uncharacterized protein n=1 Tax=Aspergillus melleus TaxID=138277 RepID=UPI001E8D5AE2|nr:uncharacterized protein LDX57_006612 [Aspergillus melleus]KAH8428939.1 hypothetical protein LDX57_006612 [Aspergillus melleus]